LKRLKKFHLYNPKRRKQFARPLPYALSLVFLILFFTVSALAQQAVISGKVSDASDHTPLIGVNIVTDSLGGAITDKDGNYKIPLYPGAHILIFRYIGYKDEKMTFEISANQDIVRNISLQPLIVELNTAVISASKYQQRLSDVTVSMDVIKPEFIENQNTQQLDEALRQIPGVDVMDGQANIRGGSGYSYGAGSRVMLLMDGLPMLTGDVNEVKWNYLPVEIIGQVEVIKGASSALYGSSALNGVINVRTATPGDVPETKVNLSGGIYNRPVRKELSWWWDGLPALGGIQASHLRKAGPFDITMGVDGFWDEGYRTDNYQHYGRFDAGLRYHPKHIEGLTTGLHTSIQLQKSSDFLIWENADSGAFIQNQVSVSPTNGFRFNIDPYVSYFDKRKGEHSLKTRYYQVDNTFPDNLDKNNGSDYFYGEYQYQREFRNTMHLTAGAAGSYTLGNSNLYGNHKGSTIALFTQFDQRFFNCLSLSLGVRWERYTLDKTDDESRPVARAGISWQAAKASFLRASFGQGYRFPSMAEKYTSTSLGSLNIFPNPNLKAESGWSAETGIRQGFRFGNWSGFVDLAAYWTEYRNMMEFTFGIYLPDSNSVPTLKDLGFKSLNIGTARINGIDFSVNGKGKAGIAVFSYFAGYTYMNPIDLSSDSLGPQILKYRYKHSAKGDFGMTIKHWSAGLTFSYQSFIERIDEAFEATILGQEFFPGLKEYRIKNDKGAIAFDIRAGWQITATSEITLFVKNLFNKEYMGRPGDIQPPRTISLQYIFRI
jgi:outer membrane receptor protein involved in Fe transport